MKFADFVKIVTFAQFQRRDTAHFAELIQNVVKLISAE